MTLASVKIRRHKLLAIGQIYNVVLTAYVFVLSLTVNDSCTAVLFFFVQMVESQARNVKKIILLILVFFSPPNK